MARLCSALGLDLDPWQRLVLDVGCRETPAGWAASEVGLCVPRQNGKTAILVARMLGGLVLLGEQQLLAAHKMSVTLETWTTVVDLLHADREIARLVARVDRTNGQEAVLLKPRPHPHRRGLVRPRLEVVAGRPAARGPRGKDLLVVDELREITPAAWAALTPTNSSPTLGIGRAQTWTASNAGADDTEILNGQRDRGRAGTDARLAWLEWSTERHWTDRDGWYEANPSLGIRKDPAAVDDAGRRSNGGPGFRTEHLCQWVRSLGDGLDMAAWTAAATRLGEPARGCVLAVDVTPARTHAAIAAAWREPDRTCARLLWSGPPYQLGDAVATARRRWHASHVVYDPVTAEGAASKQRPAWQPLTARQTSGGCQQLSDLLASGRLAWHPDDELTAAAAGAVKRPRGDGWGWGRRVSTANIAPLVALTLAVAGLDLAPARASVRVAIATTGTPVAS